MTHDDKRTGTTTLLAAFSMLDGKVIGDCMSRHRHQEFIRFLTRIDVETPFELDQNPRIFAWTASVERILARVAKCKEALGTLH